MHIKAKRYNARSHRIPLLKNFRELCENAFKSSQSLCNVFANKWKELQPSHRCGIANQVREHLQEIEEVAVSFNSLTIEVNMAKLEASELYENLTPVGNFLTDVI